MASDDLWRPVIDELLHSKYFVMDSKEGFTAGVAFASSRSTWCGRLQSLDSSRNSESLRNCKLPLPCKYGCYYTSCSYLHVHVSDVVHFQNAIYKYFDDEGQ